MWPFFLLCTYKDNSFTYVANNVPAALVMGSCVSLSDAWSNEHDSKLIVIYATVLTAEYNNLTARNFTNGATTPSPPAIAREKLSLFDIVAPVSDDLLTLNNNLQTVCLVHFHLRREILQCFNAYFVQLLHFSLTVIILNVSSSVGVGGWIWKCYAYGSSTTNIWCRRQAYETCRGVSRV